MPLAKVLALFTSAPAEKFRLRDLGHDVGRIAPGALADVVIFHPSERWTFDAAQSRSLSKNTPFHGASMLGRVQFTMVGGRVVFRASEQAK